MKYNLQLFDKLIDNNNGEEKREEVDTIIEEIKQTAFGLRTEQEIKLYIQNHQRALLEHKNFDSVYEKCDRVLYFIETHFYNFVNERLHISDLGKRKLCDQYSDITDEIRLQVKSCLNEKLCTYMQPLTELQSCKHCTIYCARYVSQFWENWLSDFRLSSSRLEDEIMISYLISQNFNLPTFFNYITGEIIGELHQEDDPYIQEQVLVSYAKRFKIIPAKIGNPFRPDYPHIKPVLDDWLNTEIKQCRKKQKKYNPQQQSIISKDGYKIETSMSVAQTAYLFKLLTKSGIITNKVQMDILHVLSEKFRSKKSDSISFDSLHNKYYNVEDRTKESVREMLKELLKQSE